MAKRRKANRRLAKQTALLNRHNQERQLLEYILNGARAERQKEWQSKVREGATTHLFVSDEWPTAENVPDLHLIEPWEHRTYEPQPFSFNKVEFPFTAHAKVYGYFVRNNATGQIMMVERFGGAPFDIPGAGGTINIDTTKLFTTM